MTAPITLFSKPGCPYCEKSKAALKNAGLQYSDLDVTRSDRVADLSVFLSGVSTVPQIFIGDLHVNGSTDLMALKQANRLEALANETHGSLDIDGPYGVIKAGAEDLILADIMPESDGTKSNDSEEWAILRFYKEFFGFWPNCFYFMHHWPEAYKLFVYAHNVGAIGGGRKILGAPVMMAAGFATSNAQGCNYCQVHMTAQGGDQSLGIPKLIEIARDGKAPDDSPIGPFEVALADLAAAAATNTVTPEFIDAATRSFGKARNSEAPLGANIMGTAMIASAFGFLNTFNDLTGVEIEADWAAQASEKAGVEPGRHGVSHDRDSNNLDHELPQNGPSIDDMVARYIEQIEEKGGVKAFAISEFGFLPNWIDKWPEHLRPQHLIFYSELMQSRMHSAISSELKHLMARVSAIVKGHDYLAAVEARLAVNISQDKARSVERVRHCYSAATGRNLPKDLFTVEDLAALKLAWISAQTPLHTPRRFVDPALSAFSNTDLIHLIIVCSVAGLVQRFVAVTDPELEAATADFMDKNGLQIETLRVRYPLASDRLELRNVTAPQQVAS